MRGLAESINSIDSTALARQRAHDAFDQIWRRGYQSRTDAYLWLAKVMNMPVSQTHISNMSIRQCNSVVKYANAFISHKISRKLKN